MENQKKYVLLDTDFIFKSHLAQDPLRNTLADIIITFEEYDFFCHEIILDELSRHQITPDPLPWLLDLIENGKVHLFTDSDILNQLKVIYGAAASSMYTTLLEKSCNTFNQGFFGQYYDMLKRLPLIVSDSEFLRQLADCDAAIPSQNELGEKKTYVLIQMMDILHPGMVYVFCSDDFAARQSLNAIPVKVHCLSILGVFQVLKEQSYGKEQMQPYFDALTGFLAKHQQDTYRVWKDHQRVKVPVKQVFDEIYEGRFQLYRNGDLSYI
ncbi:MAG: hypothetical protein ACI4NM_03280 [Bullifex sp.]